VHSVHQSAYPELALSDIRVELADERALYASQSAAHVQVGVYSTALLEGMAFGLETFLVELPGHEQLAMLSAAGLARTVADADALALWLQQSGTSHAAPPAAETLWTPRAAANFARFVEQNIG
jgi:hypothetical protein